MAIFNCYVSSPEGIKSSASTGVTFRRTTWCCSPSPMTTKPLSSNISMEGLRRWPDLWFVSFNHWNIGASPMNSGKFHDFRATEIRWMKGTRHRRFVWKRYADFSVRTWGRSMVRGEPEGINHKEWTIMNQKETNYQSVFLVIVLVICIPVGHSWLRRHIELASTMVITCYYLLTQWDFASKYQGSCCRNIMFQSLSNWLQFLQLI